MCGDLEDDTRLDDELFAWLVANARAYGAAHPSSGSGAGSALAGGATSRAAMDAAFRDALSRALSSVAAAPDGSRADAIGGHAIVLARLAGFLAGHLPPEADMFRSLVDAMLDGHREPERRAFAAREHHHHDEAQDAEYHHGARHGHGHDH